MTTSTRRTQKPKWKLQSTGEWNLKLGNGYEATVYEIRGVQGRITGYEGYLFHSVSMNNGGIDILQTLPYKTLAIAQAKLMERIVENIVRLRSSVQRAVTPDEWKKLNGIK